ncbi:MAG: biotin--[acetyl-CoA-carboxylase] ligase [Planctomycetaceae bacterium]|nr:biotin--[acetyl-CoA-carboxylase] ligase [Planctomycetaceae bacterium]
MGPMDLPPRLLRETILAGGELHDELPSTNSHALARGLSIEQVPYLVWARRQTAGRGRGQNQWWAKDGALTFTLILEPARFEIPQSNWPALSLCVGTAVCLYLQRMQITDVRLKWPNDVYVNSRKICGVLIESIPHRQGQLAVGIGLNVNNSMQSAPTDLQQRATSLCDLLGEELPLTSTLVAVLNELTGVLQLLGRNPAELPPLWRHLCWLTGRTVTITDAGHSRTGQVLGIADDGALRLWIDGREIRCVSGTVEIV